MKKSPFGPHILKKGPKIKVSFFVDDRGITEVKLSFTENNKGLEWEVVGSEATLDLIELIAKWIENYVKKRPQEISLPIVFKKHPPFTTRVLSILRDIPFGISLSYKELSEIAGAPHGARAVGNACAGNSYPLIIPCHRVLASKNGLGGFSCGTDLKKLLLEFENIPYNSGP